MYEEGLEAVDVDMANCRNGLSILHVFTPDNRILCILTLITEKFSTVYIYVCSSREYTGYTHGLEGNSILNSVGEGTGGIIVLKLVLSFHFFQKYFLDDFLLFH